MLEHKEALISPPELGVAVPGLPHPGANTSTMTVVVASHPPKSKILVEPVFAQGIQAAHGKLILRQWIPCYLTPTACHHGLA